MAVQIAFFSFLDEERVFFEQANKRHAFDIHYLRCRLTEDTAALAQGCAVICAFVNDVLNAVVLKKLAEMGVRCVALRCAGFNQVDLSAAKACGITIVRVPAYSPHAVAEHAVALLLTLNRKIHRAFQRVREADFSLHGLLGFDVYQKVVGVVGTGEIGRVFCRIMLGFGATVLAYDKEYYPEVAALGVEFVDWDTLCRRSDVISLHCPLTVETQHMVNAERLSCMKPGVLLINTGRGGLIDAKAAIAALKDGRLGGLGLDVYEEERALFFEDHSDQILQDDIFARLLTFPNVVITGHQAFFTQEALGNIANTTLNNVERFLRGQPENAVHLV